MIKLGLPYEVVGPVETTIYFSLRLLRGFLQINNLF